MARRKPTAPSRAKTESSQDRLLALLDVFSVEHPAWSVEDLREVMPMSRATLYRYLQRLCAAGLLAPSEGDAYRLGPRIIELDRQMRAGDPLLANGRPVMSKLIESFTGVLLLCSHYGERVLCIHQETSDPGIHSSMERGRPFDMFRGAPSRAILAHLPHHRLRRLAAERAAEIQAAGLGQDWPAFRDSLKRIREDGVCVAHGEIDAHLLGVGAPVFATSRRIAGSLTLVVAKRGFRDAALPTLKSWAMEAASEIGQGLDGGD